MTADEFAIVPAGVDGLNPVDAGAVLEALRQWRNRPVAGETPSALVGGLHTLMHDNRSAAFTLTTLGRILALHIVDVLAPPVMPSTRMPTDTDLPETPLGIDAFNACRILAACVNDDPLGALAVARAAVLNEPDRTTAIRVFVLLCRLGDDPLKWLEPIDLMGAFDDLAGPTTIQPD